MVNMREKAIKKLIRRNFIEMFLLIFCVIASYFIFNNNNLSASAKVAEEYSTKENSVQVMVGHNREKNTLADGSLLDTTVLTVRNPNKTEKFIEINMIIYNPQEVHIDELVVEFKDIVTDGSAAKIDQNTYKLTIYTGKIDPFGSLYDEVQIYTKNNVPQTLEYTYTVNESYYR